MTNRKKALLGVLIVASTAAVLLFIAVFPTLRTGYWRGSKLLQWLRGQAGPGWLLPAGIICRDAPFQMPTTGYIGFLWGDSFRFFTRHQGLDIFAGTEPGVTPVYAAYPGFLTRKLDWKSSVIIRIPSDPLQPGRQIWAYYTHMADPQGASFIAADFPPGSAEIPVSAGTLLGYQGNYSGDPSNPVGVHLHFSLVMDDGLGNFKNELDIRNTYDPTDYLGMNLNGAAVQSEIPGCPVEERSFARQEEQP